VTKVFVLGLVLPLCLIVVCLTTLSVSQNIQDNKLESVWKERIVII